MQSATVHSMCSVGTTGYLIKVRAVTGEGNAHRIGTEASSRESRFRVRAAVTESGYTWPASLVCELRSRRDDTASLAAGGSTSAHDLPAALATLAAQNGSTDLSDWAVIGELGLNGDVRNVRSVLPMMQGLQRAEREIKPRKVLVPAGNLAEASLAAKGLAVYGVCSLREAWEVIRNHEHFEPVEPSVPGRDEPRHGQLCFSDVKGQICAKRAMEIAAAGGHNIALVGPPGSGKTMLARRLPTILPKLTAQQALDTTAIYSVAGLLSQDGAITERPFRAPHHSISDVGLVGGGSPYPKPGEASLAHNGVLFLDELPEFRRSTLEALRQPAIDQRTVITRRLVTVSYDSRMHLVTSANACPCGYKGSVRKTCRCKPEHVERYRARTKSLGRPTQIQIEVPDVRFDQLADEPTGDTSETIRERVVDARFVQGLRLGDGRTNADMTAWEISEHVTPRLTEQARKLLELNEQNMSARDYYNTMKVARTIADMAGSEDIKLNHAGEAIALCSEDCLTV